MSEPMTTDQPTKTQPQMQPVPREIGVLLTFIDKAGAGDLRGLDYGEALDAVRALCNRITGVNLQIVRGGSPPPDKE